MFGWFRIEGFLMDLLDTSVIDDVRDALGDDAYLGFVRRMLSEMRGLGPVLTGLQGDPEALAQAAHRAAGSAVSVGASGLHGRLKAIEDSARAGGDCSALVGGLDAEIDATEAAIGALLA
ncbi:hypothetical protein HYN69_18830 (plasmid) [Gemmobacter aquarius]|uniref:HPt domain-containing protein n=2 Tax=Paragemmobacter aquarius TaxID=2169400 RepID=A0A2S0USA0_9RHOB|nr:hypothetical protein HYN69_18830 [Gemmobacter aquarius]